MFLCLFYSMYVYSMIYMCHDVISLDKIIFYWIALVKLYLQEPYMIHHIHHFW